MTWDPNKPANNESPALAPQQIRTNWQRLQAIITKDHLFQSTSQPDEGYHKVVHWITQGADAVRINGTGQLYTKNAPILINSVTQNAAQLFYISYDGTTERTAPISPVPIRAAVSFRGRTSNGPATIDYSFFVSGVQRTSLGNYTITFTSNLPSEHYIMTGTAEQLNIATADRAAAIVSRVKALGSIQVTCSGDDGNLDVDSFDIVIYGG